MELKNSNGLCQNIGFKMKRNDKNEIKKYKIKFERFFMIDLKSTVVLLNAINNAIRYRIKMIIPEILILIK